MVTKYRPDLEGYVTTNQPGATGDGYTMAEDAGAELVQMEQIQIHPTVEQETSTLIAEGVRGGGAILVNSEGNRFFDEMSTRDKVSAAELEQPGGFAWCVFDQQVYDANKAIAKYDKSGLVQKGGSVAELAEAIEVDAAALQASIDAYNAITTDGAADEFGRTEGCIAFAEGAMYAIKVAPGIHHEMGGVKINEKNEALDASGNPIAGLYAAGEVTGGIHGDNRIGGNAVCDIIVFGKNVGEVVADALAELFRVFPPCGPRLLPRPACVCVRAFGQAGRAGAACAPEDCPLCVRKGLRKARSRSPSCGRFVLPCVSTRRSPSPPRGRS